MKTSVNYGHNHSYKKKAKRTSVNIKHDHSILWKKKITGPGGEKNHKHSLAAKSKDKEMGK